MHQLFRFPFSNFLPVFCFIAILGLSCEKETSNDDLHQVIKDELVVFAPQNAATVLTPYLVNNEIVIFGETHYVQEHQDLITALLPEMHAHGFRIIFDELIHCFTWMAEDYVSGEIDEVPEFILYFNETLLEGVRAFNLTVPEIERFHLVYMDVNHWTSNFLNSIAEIEKILGTLTLFDDIQNIVVDSDEYMFELESIRTFLNSDSSLYISTWGSHWYETIQDMVNVEIESSRYRKTRNDQEREMAMLNHITSAMAKYQHPKVIVNTGMFHAQKSTFMGNKIPRIGQILQSYNPNTFSVAFIGLSGETKNRFNDTENISFQLKQNASGQNIIHAISALTGNQMGYLPLSNTFFSQGNVEISYTYNNTILVPIGKQFDAIITYPRISTLESMDKYEYE